MTALAPVFAAAALLPVRTGADVLVGTKLHLLQGRRVGLITNHTGRLFSGGFLVDTLRAKGIQITALFGPEHGVRGAAGAGEKVGDSLDTQTGIPVFSLYGKQNKPTPAMLKDVDLLIYDIQDVGARFYTYISTMKLCMEAAVEMGIPYFVLDRPNPLGSRVDGPVLEDSLRSFVGIVPIPVVYGLTIGELASMINETGMLKGGKRADLTVIWMEGWNRSMHWADTGLPWIAPSPNIPTPETADVYPATCFLEATNLSEGRGTTQPFLQFGAPFLDGGSLAQRLNGAGFPGVRFAPVTFTPTSSKHSGELCHGVRLSVSDLSAFRPVETGVGILRIALDLSPEKVTLSRGSIDRLLGIRRAYEFLLGGGNPTELQQSWQAQLEEYKGRMSPYLHYPPG